MVGDVDYVVGSLKWRLAMEFWESGLKRQGTRLEIGGPKVWQTGGTYEEYERIWKDPARVENLYGGYQAPRW